MDTQDILCEAPGPGGLTCTLPYGHQPAAMHHFEVPLPPDVGRFIEHLLKDAEAAKVRYEKAYKRQRILWWFTVGVMAVYIGLIIAKGFGL